MTESRLLAVLSVLSLVASVGLGFWSMDGIPHVQDEVVYTLQSRIFASGARWAPSDGGLEYFFWLNDRLSAGAFPVGWPALLAVGEGVGLPWLVNPLLAAALAPLMYRLAVVWLPSRTALLAAAIVSLSPAVLVLAASRMSHTSVLVALLLAAGVVARNERGRWLAAASVALAYVVMARPFDAVLVGLPLLVVATVRGQRRLWIGPTLAGVVTLFDNAYVGGDATTWPMDAWFQTMGYGDCNGLGFGARCMGAYTLDDALTGLWHNLVLFDRLLLGVHGGAVVLLAGAVVWRKPLALTLLVVPLGYALYWSSGTAYGPRYWHAALVLVPLVTAVGLERLLGRRAWVVLPVLSLAGLLRLGGLQDAWCVDRGLVDADVQTEALVLLAYGQDGQDPHPRLSADGQGLVCSAAMAMGSGVMLADPKGLAVHNARTDRAGLDAWLQGRSATVAVLDVGSNHTVLLDYAALDTPAEDPDTRVAQAWALRLLGETEGSRARVVGLQQPVQLLSLARLHRAAEEPEVALAVVEVALREDPSDPGALLLKANLQVDLGDLELGNATWLRAEAAREDR